MYNEASARKIVGIFSEQLYIYALFSLINLHPLMQSIRGFLTFIKLYQEFSLNTPTCYTYPSGNFWNFLLLQFGHSLVVVVFNIESTSLVPSKAHIFFRFFFIAADAILFLSGWVSCP